jgi:hypothetical protein
MMGRRSRGQERLFYEFHLDEAVPDDHLVRKVAAVLDLSWVHAELAPYYPQIGRPSIDPELMNEMIDEALRLLLTASLTRKDEFSKIGGATAALAAIHWLGPLHAQ